MEAIRQYQLSTRDIARCRQLGLVVDEVFERSSSSPATRRHTGSLAVMALALAVVVIGVMRVDRARAHAVPQPQNADQHRAGRHPQPRRHALPSKRVNV